MSDFNSDSGDYISPIPKGQLTDEIKHEAQSLDSYNVSSSELTVPQQAVDVIDVDAGSSSHSAEHEALDVNGADGGSSSHSAGREALDVNGADGGSSRRSEALGGGISALLEGIVRDFDSKAVDTARSQDQLSDALNRLTRELDQLLEDAPVPFMKQHAARISGVRNRVSSMNSVLRSIQRRIDNIDRMLTVKLPHGHEKLSKGSN